MENRLQSPELSTSTPPVPVTAIPSLPVTHQEGEAAVAQVAEQLRQAQSEWRAWHYAERHALGRQWVGAGLFLFALFALLSRFPLEIALGGWVGGLLITIFIVFFSQPYRCSREDTFRAGAIRTLPECNEVRAVGMLVEAWAEGSKEIRAAIEPALIRLLPQLGPDNASLLLSIQRAILRNYLKTEVYTTIGIPGARYDLAIAILQAFGQMGGMDELEVIVEIARQQPFYWEQKALVEAAIAARDAIVARYDAMGEFGGIREIPIWVRQLSRESPLKQITVLVLPLILPRLSDAEAASLDPDLRHQLYHYLASRLGSQNDIQRDGAELATEIVRLAYRLKEREVLRTVRMLSQADAPSEPAQRLRIEARKTRDLLEEDERKRAVGKELLRASDAPAAYADELLRPAAGSNPPADPQQLLRPSQQDDHEAKPKPSAL